jgi:hypothetical protein
MKIASSMNEIEAKEAMSIYLAAFILRFCGMVIDHSNNAN